jgi:hypothetical protein
MMSGEEPRGGVTQAAIGIRLGEGGWVAICDFPRRKGRTES